MANSSINTTAIIIKITSNSSNSSISIIISIKVKDLGMAGVTLFSINSENEEYRGELARRVAEELYL